MSQTVERRRVLSQRIRALLVGGIVFGIGTAATLAAWNDSEYASGDFSSGVFNLQGSTTSASAGFADHASAGSAATLSFTSPVSNLRERVLITVACWGGWCSSTRRATGAG